MRIKTVAATIVIGCLLVLLLAACGMATGQPLRDIHPNGEMDKAVFVDRSLCLSCHNEENIIRSTQNYGGEQGLNIHQPPESMLVNYGDCTSCHSVDSQPTNTCNSCHDYKVPDKWLA